MSSRVTPEDRRFMARALAVAEQARGRVSPNPFVGCVVVGDGEVLGEGATQPPGGPHAEVMALRAAGGRASGATAYVTLEPCDHVGRTPPCTRALIQAGITRVVVALRDPNPLARGGAATLQAAGIDVDLDVAVDEARRQNEVFLHGLAMARPFVVAKTASSLDGFIADTEGRSRWITSPWARARGQLLRAEVDAVLVGSGTALADDPALTVRLDGWTGPQPLRVVLDRRRRLDGLDLRLLTDGLADTLVLDLPSPRAVLTELWDRGVHSVLVEGGAGVVGAFLAADLVDRFEMHLGGVILGQGLSGVGAAFTLAAAPRLRIADVATSDDDVVVTAYPKRG